MLVTGCGTGNLLGLKALKVDYWGTRVGRGRVGGVMT